MTIFIWGIIFIVAMIITGIIGFKKPRGNSAARTFFYIFLILFLAVLGYGLWQKYSGRMSESMQMSEPTEAMIENPNCCN